MGNICFHPPNRFFQPFPVFSLELGSPHHGQTVTPNVCAFCKAWRMEKTAFCSSPGKGRVCLLYLLTGVTRCINVYVCMSPCVHMHVCIYVCRYARMQVCLDTWMPVRMYARIYACINVFTHSCRHAYIHVYLRRH